MKIDGENEVLQEQKMYDKALLLLFGRYEVLVLRVFV